MNEHITAQKIDDDSLETVSAGTFLGLDSKPLTGTVEHIFQVGDIVEVKSGFSTVRCRITQLGMDYEIVPDSGGSAQKTFVDTYYCEKVESSLFFVNGWKDRDQIVTPGTK